jgi:hypothetical protein
MSAAPQDRDERDEPRKIPASRARMWIALAFVVVLVIVFGYLILVGGLVGD